MNIDQHRLQTQNSTTIVQTSLPIFDSFHPATIARVMITMMTMMKSSKPTSCALDPIPTSLLLECFDDILPILAHFINSSILSCKLMTNMKTAVVKGLLINVLYKQTNSKIIDLCHICLSSQKSWRVLFSSSSWIT